MPLSIELAARHVNTLSRFLSLRDLPCLSPEAVQQRLGRPQVDLLILFGGSIPYGCQVAAEAFLSGIAKQLLIVGGEGHTTPHLRRCIHQRYPQIETEGRMEAEILADYFCVAFGISDCHIERASTNCGENVRFARQVVEREGLAADSLLILQDSTMQRRMDATFRKVWADRQPLTLNYAAYLAKVAAKDERLVFCGPPLWGMWEMDRYISLLLGEIPRLTDGPEGYGPRGKGYIAHVDIPDAVRQAFDALREGQAGSVRPPWQPQR